LFLSNGVGENRTVEVDLAAGIIRKNQRTIHNPKPFSVNKFMSEIIHPGIYMISGLSPAAQNLGDFGYFGLSVHPEKRIDQHLAALRGEDHKNKAIQQFYSEFGKNHLIYDIVEECDLDQLAEREKARIKEGNTYRNPLGFNLTPGGEGAAKRDGNFYSFEDTENQIFITGQNIAMFARANPQYDLDRLYQLWRGEIPDYKGLIVKKW
jgi:hypothetical protein